MTEAFVTHLFDCLGDVDDTLVENASAVCDREALLQYARTKKKAMSATSQKKRRISRILSTAAAFLLAVAVALTLPRLFVRTPPVTPPPPAELLTIDSIDELNYYAALRVLGDVSAAHEQSMRLGGRTWLSRITPLAAPRTGDRVVYDLSELSAGGVFIVTAVIYFRVEIPEGCYLAERVGAGIAEVVVTQNNIDNMITVKNGDRYYSCCRNGASPNREHFSTHKYVTGMSLVKDFTVEGRTFTVVYDEWNFENPNYRDVLALALACESHMTEEGAHEMPVLGPTYTAEVNETFTISMLEDYFNRGIQSK